jgi:hypothetical protein
VLPEPERVQAAANPPNIVILQMNWLVRPPWVTEYRVHLGQFFRVVSRLL